MARRGAARRCSQRAYQVTKVNRTRSFLSGLIARRIGTPLSTKGFVGHYSGKPDLASRSRGLQLIGFGARSGEDVCTYPRCNACTHARTHASIRCKRMHAQHNQVQMNHQPLYSSTCVCTCTRAHTRPDTPFTNACTCFAASA